MFIFCIYLTSNDCPYFKSEFTSFIIIIIIIILVNHLMFIVSTCGWNAAESIYI